MWQSAAEYESASNNAHRSTKLSQQMLCPLAIPLSPGYPQNWLFKGSLSVGERAANLMTIIGNAIRNDLDVHAYLDDVLRRSLAGETDWATLAPHTWRDSHPESIRTYRQDERRQAADRERTRRARRRRLKK